MATRYQQGLTLIEVMIAIVILGIGLLGLAALHSAGLRQTHNSYLLAVAAQQAEEMAERMRANPQGVANGDYNALAGLGTSTADCDNNACSSLERSGFDHAVWSAENRNYFGTGNEGSVTIDGVTGVFDIAIAWTEVNSDGGGTLAKTYTLAFLP